MCKRALPLAFAAASLVACTTAPLSPPLKADASDLAACVDPFIGTDDSRSPHPVPGGAGGSTYPGAVVPFGMVQLSPDTPTASPSGYRYGDAQVEQLSLTHFDGAGCPNNEDLFFVLFVGVIERSPGTSWERFRARAEKTTEVATPGLYSVQLGGIEVELTATKRTGFARFTFPSSTSSQLLLSPGRSATGVRAGSVRVVDEHHIEGTATAGGFCSSSDQTFQIFFVAEVDKPIAGFGTWTGDTLHADVRAASGDGVGAYVTFDTRQEPAVQMKIGISYVSLDGARANLAAESPGFDFAQVAKDARAQWETVLRRVQVAGGTPDDRTKLYTALYHVFQNPNIASDVTGKYMGFDGNVHSSPQHVTYQNYSGWDIIRSWTHLMAAIAPETPDIIRSMVEDGIEGGLLPFWTQESMESHVMVGDPGTVNVANAYAMGVRGFDENAALQLMLRSASDRKVTQRSSLGDWLDLHYTDNGAVSLEYAMADFTIAQFAGALGHSDVQKTFMHRSGWWRTSFDDARGFFVARIGNNPPYGSAARIYEVEVYEQGVDVAKGARVTASGQCNANEAPASAVNGTVDGGPSDKWCENTTLEPRLDIDLGDVAHIDRVVIAHAAAGGEPTQWNTQAFTISVSVDGVTFTPVAVVTDNHEAVTTHAFEPADARFVRLSIQKAIQVGKPGELACEPFDPASECGFIEGNAAQYVWLVPHDMHGLFDEMGGPVKAVARLDDLFLELNAGTNRPHFYIGNEPEHGTPWTYNFAHQPAKTAEVVQRIVDEEANVSPGGLPGNDDLGATSAWLVWAYLGSSPAIPGTDVLAAHGPRFPSATLALASGETLTVRADGGSPEALYVQGLSVNGTPTTRSWLHFADVAHGGALTFTMGTKPSTWGTGEGDEPPSFASE